MMENISISQLSTEEEVQRRAVLLDKLKTTPIPDKELLDNIGLYLKRQTLSRILFMNELYQKILHTHGVIMEFGVRWGQNLSLFSSYRGIYEPYNYNRKIIGFDTFEGFPKVHEKDGARVKEGDYAVTNDYEDYLENILNYHESESPISHLKKFELVVGDASETIDTYMEEHPETIIALAYFDFDIYLPTRKCLEAIKNRLTKGSILAFDELNYSVFPGETVAFHEVFGIHNYRIQRSPLAPLCSYIVIE